MAAWIIILYFAYLLQFLPASIYYFLFWWCSYSNYILYVYRRSQTHSRMKRTRQTDCQSWRSSWRVLPRRFMMSLRGRSTSGVKLRRPRGSLRETSRFVRRPRTVQTIFEHKSWWAHQTPDGLTMTSWWLHRDFIVTSSWLHHDFIMIFIMIWSSNKLLATSSLSF